MVYNELISSVDNPVAVAIVSIGTPRLLDSCCFFIGCSVPNWIPDSVPNWIPDSVSNCLPDSVLNCLPYPVGNCLPYPVGKTIGKCKEEQ